MADKLLIIMVNTDPKNGAELGAPFFQATVAAAMEYEVEIVLTGQASSGHNRPLDVRLRQARSQSMFFSADSITSLIIIYDLRKKRMC